MEDITISNAANIAGMSHLINTRGSQVGFNPLELEEQIIGGARAFPKKGNLAQELESEIDKLTGGFRRVEPSRTAPFERPTMSTSDDLDALLLSMDDEPTGASSFAPPQNARFNAFPEEDPDDQTLLGMTNEQRKQNVISEAFNDIDQEHDQRPAFSVEREKEEDEKTRKLESIESLREILKDEGENLSRIPNVSSENSLKEIDDVYKMLNLKNDRKRCCTFAEEGILLGAHGVEWAFDGEKSYFGHRPDMTDWHKSVQGKLRRMRHDTSNVVSQVMQTCNMGSGMRILFEIIPSMFLYSRMRKTQTRDNLVSDSEYGDALNKLRDHDTRTD